MLSSRERARLAAIELEMIKDDPLLASRLRNFEPGEQRDKPSPAHRVTLGFRGLIVMLALLPVLSGLVISGAVFAAVAVGVVAALTAGFVVLYRRCWTDRRGSGDG